MFFIPCELLLCYVDVCSHFQRCIFYSFEFVCALWRCEGVFSPKHLIFFQVPLVEKCEIQLFEVKVEGPTVYSKEVKKVLIKTVKPQTFIQTDAAIYNPGQTGNLDLMMMKMELFCCRMFSQMFRLAVVLEKMSQPLRISILRSWKSESPCSRKAKNKKLLSLLDPVFSWFFD